MPMSYCWNFEPFLFAFGLVTSAICCGIETRSRSRSRIRQRTSHRSRTTSYTVGDSNPHNEDVIGADIPDVYDQPSLYPGRVQEDHSQPPLTVFYRIPISEPSTSSRSFTNFTSLFKRQCWQILSTSHWSNITHPSFKSRGLYGKHDGIELSLEISYVRFFPFFDVCLFGRLFVKQCRVEETNRKHIYKWWIFHGYVRIPEGIFDHPSNFPSKVSAGAGTTCYCTIFSTSLQAGRSSWGFC